MVRPEWLKRLFSFTPPKINSCGHANKEIVHRYHFC